MKRKTTGERNRIKASCMLIAITALMVPLIVFVGCSKDPVSPANTYFNTQFQEPGTAASGITAAKNLLVQYVGEGEVSATEGGIVSISMPGKGNFVVAPNSISQNTTITANVQFFEFSGINIGLFDFSPDGLAFSSPATLQFETKVLGGGNSVSLYWLNPDTYRWEFQGRYTADANDQVSIPIDHFSKYGVSD